MPARRIGATRRWVRQMTTVRPHPWSLGPPVSQQVWDTETVAKGGRVQRMFGKYFVNPMIRSALRVGGAPRAIALLETTGRRSDAPRLTPVGNGLNGSILWLVSEHGKRCDYVKKLIADPNVRVNIRRTWHSRMATLVPNGNGIVRGREPHRTNGLIGRTDGVIVRASASETLTIRIELNESSATPDRRPEMLGCENLWAEMGCDT
jgi:deazaflavin-dependent oxidoreductase (nitroreductase family)